MEDDGEEIVIVEAGPQELDLVVPLFDEYRKFYGETSDLCLARQFISARLEQQDSVVFLAIGLPCLFWPRAVQRLANHIYRFDHERRKAFIAGGGYLVMVRLLGVLWTCAGLFLVAILVIPGFAVFQ